MKSLPVPDLGETLARMMRAVEAVASDDVVTETRKRATACERGHGPRLQADVEALAREAAARGESWLSEEWSAGYLSVREPLPLSTNVSFQLTGDFGEPGIDRVGNFLYRVAAVHLSEARGETPPEVDARGNTADMRQWECLNGGLRHPGSPRDVIRRSELGAAHREIGIFLRGHLYAVPVSGDAGRPFPPSFWVAAVRAVLDAAPSVPEPGEGFADPSYLGSGALADLLPGMVADEGNAAVYRRLTDFLFTVTLVEPARPDADHLRDFAFRPGHAWVRKPISYEIGLADDWLCLHAEHTAVDGATLLAAVGRMQEVEVSETRENVPEPMPEEWRWELEEPMRERLGKAVTEYACRAEPYAVRIVTVPGLPEDLPFKVSADAVQQLIMTTAQIVAFGHARSAYEAVDMREYLAGRTECLRPVTPEAVACARVLAEGAASAQDVLPLFREAVNAHREWVKACKAGQGFDRHLLALRRAAERAGVDEPLFRDEGLRLAQQDFLSTTSIGGADRIVRYAFAPSVPEGYGITYTPNDGGFEFCVSWREDTAERPEEFFAALARAGELVRGFLEEARDRGSR